MPLTNHISETMTASTPMSITVLIRLLEENARLRALVTQLSTLVLKQVAEQK